MTDLDAHRFAPPRAALADVPPPAGPAYGGRGARLGAAMLDGVLGLVVAVVVFVSIGGWGDLPDVGNADKLGELFGRFAFGYAIVALIQGLFLWQTSQTLGKRLLGLRVVRRDGRRAGFVRLFVVRAGAFVAVSMIPFLGGLVSLVNHLLIFRDSHQCLHDQLCDTIVVTAESSRDATRAAALAARADVRA